MQIAPVRYNPVNNPAIVRAATVLAFAVLFLGTGLALTGVEFGGQPTSPAVGYTALFLVGLLASVTLFLPVPMIGTYSARVIFHKGFYSGVWYSNLKNYGGVLSGRVTKSKSSTDATPKPAQK